MTGVLEKFGLRLLYPENWTTDVSEESQWPRNITLQSPGSAFWSVQVFESDSETPPQQLLAEALETLRAEYGEPEEVPVEEELEGIWVTGVDLSFYYLDFLISASLRSFSHQQRAYLVLYQAENREFASLQPVLAAMTIGLCRGLADAARSGG